MKKLFVLGMLLVNVSVFAGNEKGNGGFIQGLLDAELRDRATLTMSDIDKLVENKGEEIKNKVLIPVMDKFLLEKAVKLSPTLIAIQKVFIAQSSKLKLDMKLTHFEVGTCPTGATTCTGDEPFSKIVIDKAAIQSSRFGVSFSELVGLLIHEFEHHFFHETLEHDSYPLARFMMNIIKTSDYLEKTYSTSQILNAPSIFAGGLWFYSGSADLFCQSKGHNEGAKNFKRMVSLSKADAVDIGLGNGLYYQPYRIIQLVNGKFHFEFYDTTRVRLEQINSYSSITCWDR
jgi:hypothetical protein